MIVHIEGMGVLGSILAWSLEAKNIPFTWHDTNDFHSAWPACTGCIYPTGEAEEMRAYAIWLRWMSSPIFKPYMESAGYWFNTKNPPHGARCAIIDEDGDLRRAGANSIHFNAQGFVRATRQEFADLRYSVVLPNETVVVAHGSARATSFTWGWHALVGSSSERRCVTLREDRYQTAYLYPHPGDQYFYVGSSMVSQKQPHVLDVQPHYARVAKMLAKYGIELTETIWTEQGWRPKGPTEPLVECRDGKLYLPPMGASGVRLAPLVIEALLKELHD